MENKHIWEEVEKRFDERFNNFNGLTRKGFFIDISDDIKSFIRQEIDLAVKRKEMDIRNIIVKLRNEFANTPISERGNGWDWLGKVEEKITPKGRD